MSVEQPVVPLAPPVKGNMVKIYENVDYSFMKLSSLPDLLSETPRGKKEREAEEKYSTRSVKLNNNHLQVLSDLSDILSLVILRPQELTWIDVSFNELKNIDRSFTKFPKLQILYMHGNRIDDISEVDKLSEITTLRKLALHGNGIENIKNYRWYVVQRVPQVVNLDMSMVTAADRTTASHAVKPASPSKKKDKAG